MDEPEQQPVDLSPLGAVGSPNVVRRAVRRYRRRIILVFASVLLVIALSVGAFWWFVVRPVRDTPARIHAAATVTSEQGVIKEIKGYQVIVVETAELLPAFGAHFMVIAPKDAPGYVNIHPKGVSYENNIFADAPSFEQSGPGRVSEHWFIVDPGNRRKIEFVLEVNRGRNSRRIGEFSVEREFTAVLMGPGGFTRENLVNPPDSAGVGKRFMGEEDAGKKFTRSGRIGFWLDEDAYPHPDLDVSDCDFLEPVPDWPMEHDGYPLAFEITREGSCVVRHGDFYVRIVGKKS